MSNTDKLRKMYSEISAPENAVKACLDIPQNAQKTVHFPYKKAILIAASIALVLAVAIPVGAGRIRSAFGAVDDYGSQFPQKTQSNYSIIDSNSAYATEGDKLSAAASGLEISIDKVYYDGAFVYLSFLGNYSGDFTNIDRFIYSDSADFVTIDGEPVKAELTNYSFCLLESEGSFGGVLGFIYPYDKEELSVKVDIPYLEALSKDDMEVAGMVKGEFSLSFKALKSAPSVLVYNAESTDTEVSVLGVTSSQGGICVEIFVPQEILDKKAGILSVVETEDGTTADFILGKRDIINGGYILKQYFSPVNSDTISVYVYDKNDTDGCENTPCLMTSLEDVCINIAE